LNSLSYLPRWVVLIIDLGVVFFTFVFTYLLFSGLKTHYFDITNLGIMISLYGVFNLFYFWWFKTYSGIIRHSSFIDAIKIFFAQSFVFISLIIFNTFYLFLKKEQLFLNSALLVNIVLSFSLLFFYRVIVKQVFEVFIKDSHGGNIINALVYGADANAISVSNALTAEIPSRFKLLGFIDKYNEDKPDMNTLCTNEFELQTLIF
jgi:FlaA1/EpsC-like NDP-sugar epimerase